MKSKQSWYTTILRGMLILIATALLTLAIFQRVIVDPRTCQDTLTEFKLQPWIPVLAQATVDAVPEENWTPYIPHYTGVLSQVYANTIDPNALETAICPLATSISRYWLGIEPGDSVRNAVIDLLDHLDDDWIEHTRAALWESLPVCPEGPESNCVAADLETRRLQAIEHTAWWQSYWPQLRTWLGNIIIAQVNALPLLQPWIMQLHLLDILPIVFLTLSSVPWRPRRVLGQRSKPDSNSNRATHQALNPLHDMERVAEGRVRSDRVRSLPFLITGILLAILSILALFANLPAPRTPVASGATVQSVIDLIWQSLWRALLPAFGWRALTLGAIMFSIGLILTAITVQLPWQRWLLLITTIVLVTGALMLDQVYRNDQAPIVVNTSDQATPTAWPTLTPTPPPTSTPTPTSPVYWPVQPGTPMPTPSTSLDAETLTQIACLSATDDAPIQHIHAESTGFTVFQAESYTRYALPSLSRITQRDNAHTLDETATYLVNQRVAIVEDESLWIYNIPTWTAAMPTRFATFADITSVYSNPHVNTNRLILGLDNGFVWEARPSTGALLAMRDVSDKAISNSALCGEYLLISDDTGLIRLWNWSAGEELALWQRHSAPLVDLTCSADNAYAFSLDINGDLIRWDLEEKRFDTQLSLAMEPVTTLILHNNQYWIGMQDGTVVAINPETMQAQHFTTGNAPITALAIVDSQIILTGNPTGSVCLWESVKVK